MPDPSRQRNKHNPKNKILVVEDEMLVRTYLIEIYIDLGYDIAWAETISGAKEALLCNFSSICFISLDLNLHGENANIFIDWVRSINFTNPIIIVTACAPSYTPSSVNACIEKPFREEELIELLKEVGVY